MPPDVRPGCDEPYVNSLLLKSNLNYKVGKGGGRQGDTTLIHKKGIVRRINNIRCINFLKDGISYIAYQ